MLKEYEDMQSIDKDYVNMMVRQAVRDDPEEGELVYLDGLDCRSTECYIKSINSERLTVVENNPDVFQTQSNHLQIHENITHVHSNVFDHLKSVNPPTHLYLDLMTDCLKETELNIVKDWFSRVISDKRDPNLFLTLTGRSRSKGRLTKRLKALTEELSALDLGIGLKTEYAYCRKGKSSMVFLHFCLYEGETECRPHRIERRLPDGSYLVKWWGNNREGTIESPDSPVLKILESEEIKHFPEAEMLSKCVLDLPDVARDGVTLHPVGFLKGYLFNIRFLNVAEELRRFYIQSIPPSRNDNLIIFMLGGLINFLKEKDQRHALIFQDAFNKLQIRNNVPQTEAENHFAYAEEMWSLCMEYPLFTMTKFSLDGFCGPLKTFLRSSENEHLLYFLRRAFWEKSPADHLRWCGRKKDLFLDLQDHAKIIINDPKTKRWV